MDEESDKGDMYKCLICEKEETSFENLTGYPWNRCEKIHYVMNCDEYVVKISVCSACYQQHKINGKYWKWNGFPQKTDNDEISGNILAVFDGLGLITFYSCDIYQLNSALKTDSLDGLHKISTESNLFSTTINNTTYILSEKPIHTSPLNVGRSHFNMSHMGYFPGRCAPDKLFWESNDVLPDKQGWYNGERLFVSTNYRKSYDDSWFASIKSYITNTHRTYGISIGNLLEYAKEYEKYALHTIFVVEQNQKRKTNEIIDDTHTKKSKYIIIDNESKNI